MKIRLTLASLLMAIALGIGNGCVTQPKVAVDWQQGESLVLVGQEPAFLARLPHWYHKISLRSAYLPGRGVIDYVEGRDFVVDLGRGSIKRTTVSRIPDFRTNMLYGKEDFDHSKYPGFGNGPFFVYADYAYLSAQSWPNQAPQTRFLKATAARLTRGEPLKIVAFGDSITAGGDATRPDLIFWQRWADELQQKYPRARVSAVNGATGGDATPQGLQRLKAKVIDEHPDLVLIGFGMNDHNKNGVPIPDFTRNLKEMIARIRAATPAEIILYSAFPPNPKWKFGSHHIEDYAAATQRVAQDTACAFADVYSNWESIAARKKPEDLLGNNVNHPNDFGHSIYYRVLMELGL
jgi:acyl-CoA thioesterase I